MLRDPLLQSRAERYLARVSISRGRRSKRTAAIPRSTISRGSICGGSRRALSFYTRDLNRDIVGAFAQLQAEGIIEIITCAATHGFLPLMDGYPEAMRAQIMVGRDSYVECFGREPAGIWLPECAYVAPVARLLQEANIRWFVVDAHG